MRIMNLRTISLQALLLPALSLVAHAEDLKLEYHGAGWTQIGRVEESYAGTANVQNDNDNNWMQNVGAQLSVTAKVDAHWDAGLSIGVVGVHGARGQREVADFWYPFWVPYIGEARVTYTDSVFNAGRFQLTMGNFGYGYGSNNKNLGLYLMRGYVYPGALESGFGNVFGALARYDHGKFRNDVIVKSEEQRPAYDLSLIDVVSYQVHPGFELGAGVNFYRLIPRDGKLTTPDSVCSGSYGFCSIMDPSDSTLVLGSLAGTKVMARFSADPKLLFGFSNIGSLAFGKQDLVFYGEAAIIGVKDYRVVYDDILQRIPVMLGLNLPTFGHLDVFSIEGEYYASKNSSDNFHANFGGAWVPRQDDDDVYARDDWKWSVNAAKTLVGNLQLSAQVANDHLRLGGWHNEPNSGKEALRTPKDWYWTCKLAYFF
jgi:hypothetical protein